MVRGGRRHPSFFAWSRSLRHFFSCPRARSQVLGALQRPSRLSLQLLGDTSGHRKSGPTPSTARSRRKTSFSPPAFVSPYFLAFLGLLWGSKPPLPISLSLSAVLSRACRAIFTTEGDCLRVSVPRFGREDLKSLPCRLYSLARFVAGNRTARCFRHLQSALTLSSSPR